MKKLLPFICLGLSLAGCQPQTLPGEPAGTAVPAVVVGVATPSATLPAGAQAAEPPAAAGPEPGTLDDLVFPPPVNPDLDHAKLLTSLVFPWNEGGEAQLRQIRESGDPRFIAGLIDCLRYRRDLAGEISATLQHLAGQEVEGDWHEWQEWAGKRPQIPNFEGYPAWKAELFAQIDANFRRFVYDGMKISPGSRPEEIVWGGVYVDGIPALDNPRMVDPAEADYLVPYERVFGVSLNGDSRAYPTRFLDWHEMFNDVVGGEPVSLAY